MQRAKHGLCGLAYAHSNSSRDFLQSSTVLTRSSPTTTVDNIIENVRNPTANTVPFDRAAMQLHHALPAARCCFQSVSCSGEPLFHNFPQRRLHTTSRAEC